MPFQGAGVGLVIPELLIRAVCPAGSGSGVGIGALRTILVGGFPSLFFGSAAAAFPAGHILSARIIGAAHYRSGLGSGLLSAYARFFVESKVKMPFPYMKKN